MPQLLTINVKNYQSQTQNFYFFQQPAIYTGGGQLVVSGTPYGAAYSVTKTTVLHGAQQWPDALPKIGRRRINNFVNPLVSTLETPSIDARTLIY
ncbi:hypothetical protein [Rhizobium bangladeshense]|uniref:hypothetical protein n=1 Tax=Rhizobium bangladeshense TaxID=1138189 RepID=UPI0007E59260|nr:hypothetical protein [Rhizobium bangladeshense]